MINDLLKETYETRQERTQAAEQFLAQYTGVLTLYDRDDIASWIIFGYKGLSTKRKIELKGAL